MRITDCELNIKTISDVQKGRIAPSNTKCKNRHSDCFVFVKTGEAEYTFDGKKYSVSAGNVFYIASGSNYTISVSDENYTFVFVDFFFDDNTDTVFENQIFSSKGITMLENRFEALYQLWCMGDFADKIYCKSVIYDIYSEIVKSTLKKYISPDKRYKIEEITEYISKNIADESLSIEGLSRMYDISEVHFRRIFACVYHTSPIKFITSLRLKKAKELLVCGDIPISEISRICGFKNPYYFSKVFKKETLMTPSEFRRFYENIH